ncbi:MAG: prenyltransferase/squalene oxidase repeat-containing protein [Planctomycetota bacterium]
MPPPSPDIDPAIAATRERLLGERSPAGHWIGRLSSSALATAVACAALAEIDPHRHRDLIRGGLDWLVAHQNADGGYGDTVISRSNINTTSLCWGAFAVATRIGQGDNPAYLRPADRAAGWIATHCGFTGTIEPRALVQQILAFYGRDRTFSTPICSLIAICGRLGPRHEAFALIPQLPFELAALPQRIFRWLRLPVVSYAIPALVAIGQSRHHHRPSPFPWMRRIRDALRRPTLDLVRRMQPSNGGFIEAPPLPSFVALNLAATGLRDHPIVNAVVGFLEEVVRDDGAWPICTDLATWTTTLSVNAMAVGEHHTRLLDPAERTQIVDWLLSQQHATVHPFTGAAPGGWGWSDRPGAIADADDTPGVLLTLAHLARDDQRVRTAAAAACVWLLDLQNRDGGIPTFCRGWNKLPFDRSAADLTAHTIAGWQAWSGALPPPVQARVDAALPCALAYLARSQRGDGAWIPLWFGNQWAPDDRNPVYGTARVLVGLESCATSPTATRMRRHGAAWLRAQQNPDGSWGGVQGVAPSVEETALAIQALCGTADPEHAAAIDRGLAWLLQTTDAGRQFPPAPIGFYFEKLWYFERLYPVIFTLGALHAAQRYRARR